MRGMVLKIMQYNVSIFYRQGTKNKNADGLSPQSWPESEELENMENGQDAGVMSGIPASLPVANLSKGGCGTPPTE